MRRAKRGYRSLSAVLAACASAVTGRTIAVPFAHDDAVYLEGATGLSQLDQAPTSLAVRLRMFRVGKVATAISGNEVGV